MSLTNIEQVMPVKLAQALANPLFPALDSALRAGRHIGLDELDNHAFLMDFQDYLEEFYARYNVELIRAPEGFFYLRPRSTTLISRSVLSELDMMVGKILCYLYLSPERLANEGIFTQQELYDELLTLADESRLLKLVNNRSTGSDLDRQKLQEYEETKEQVLALWNQLEEEKTQLQADKDQLEADKADLESQKSELDVMLAKKKKESANFDAEIKKAKQEASVAKALLQQEQKQLKQLQAQAQRGNTAAATGSYTTTNYTSVIDNASGSDMGKRLAKYACQYIGNPYVAGGTSLTNGADCSGFTFRIYSDFGYSIPRTSYEQRSCGTGVDYSSAQPGDLICYDGHVAMYIGGGLIVHASTQRTGIKVSNANYRPILAVRRVV